MRWLAPVVDAEPARRTSESTKTRSAVIASRVHPEPEIVLVHDGIGIREIVLSANGELDSIDDLPPYLNAALSEALTQFQDEVVTELGRAWPELPLTGALPFAAPRSTARYSLVVWGRAGPGRHSAPGTASSTDVTFGRRRDRGLGASEFVWAA
jgi:hypothetical protein